MIDQISVTVDLFTYEKYYDKEQKKRNYRKDVADD